MDTSTISILIVDDEPLNREVFSHLLKKSGYMTRAVGSGAQTIELMKLEKFDMILLDINMPEINGVQVLEHIKKNKITSDVPVIMVTAENDNNTVIRCIKLGADDYIKKPVEPTLLRSRIWRCVQKHKNFTGAEPPATASRDKPRAHIMVVDDDEHHRAIVQHRLAANNHIILQASNGLEAIELLETNQVDLILLDVAMPGLDGYQTLERIKASENNRQIPILMCSADDSPKTIDKCLKAGADDYVLKPFNAALLNARIDSCLRIDASGTIKSTTQANPPDIIKDLAYRLKNDKILFPVMPDTAIQVDKLLKENDDVNINEISAIIKADPALTMRLIGISNSAYYRGAIATKNLEDAIMRLGMRETQNYLLLLTTRSLFESDTPPFKALLDGLWIHSLATAEAARLLGKQLEFPDLNQLFTLGMLHDMGKLLLLQVLYELNRNGREMDKANIMSIVDSQHMAFGAALMRKWNMPSEFSYTAEQHHTLAEGGSYTRQFLIVCLANLITRKPGFSLKEDDGEDLVASYPARSLGVDAAMIDRVSEDMQAYVASIRHIA
jgi:putative nucleotidyltransferase with HDIG domain